ncbi:hypothetical protein [Micromonospora sp. NPDC005806]|uniref:hypothetical protein n=1 Tax=Micromonospora sp. NPDC005806 TaxID=3364234 RepID=UPI003695E658
MLPDLRSRDFRHLRTRDDVFGQLMTSPTVRTSMPRTLIARMIFAKSSRWHSELFAGVVVTIRWKQRMSQPPAVAAHRGPGLYTSAYDLALVARAVRDNHHAARRPRRCGTGGRAAVAGIARATH